MIHQYRPYNEPIRYELKVLNLNSCSDVIKTIARHDYNVAKQRNHWKYKKGTPEIKSKAKYVSLNQNPTLE